MHVRKRKSRAKTVKPTAFTWEVQKAGLPAEERQRLREILGKKTASSSQQRQAQAGPAATNAVPQAATAAAAQGATAEQPTQPPKRSHHRQQASFAAPLPLEWERLDKGKHMKGHLYGVRKRLPKTVREAALKSIGGRARKIEFRETPKIKAINDDFARKFNEKREIMTKDAETGTPARLSTMVDARRPPHACANRT